MVTKAINIVVAGPGDLKQEAERSLSGQPFTVRYSSLGRAAPARIGREKPDVLVVQVAEGQHLYLRQVRDASPGTRVITVVGRKAGDLKNPAVFGSDDVVFRPLRPAELGLRVARVIGRAGQVREAGARPWVSVRPQAPQLPDLHDPRSGRVDAKRMAGYLGVPLTALAKAIGKDYKAVFKSPASVAVQERARELHGLLVSLRRIFGDRHRVLAWLNTANEELGRESPMDLILEGRSGVVLHLVERTLAGVPT